MPQKILLFIFWVKDPNFEKNKHSVNRLSGAKFLDFEYELYLIFQMLRFLPSSPH